MVDIDQDQVELPALSALLFGGRRERGIDVRLDHPEAGVAVQLVGQWHPPVAHPVDHLRQELDHVDTRHPGRAQGFVRRVPETEPANQNPETVAFVPLQRAGRERHLGDRVIAAHQQVAIEGDLGDDCPGSRQQLATPQADHAERGLFVGEHFEVRGGHARIAARLHHRSG